MKLKVCGMREPANIAAVAEMNPDFMGFIFYSRSPRNADPDILRSCLELLNPRILRVGVFVNETTDRMIEIASMLSLNYVQLHGDESPETCARMSDAGFGVIKVFHVSEEADIRKTAPYEKLIDYFLFDTRTPQYGGSGKRFEWSLLSAYRAQVPYLLSGGIGPEDIAGIRDIPMPAAIDVNSKIEIQPGLKDPARLRTLIEQLALLT